MQAIEDYTFEEENLIVQSAVEKREKKTKLIKDQLHFFQIRSNVIQNYFIRLSAPQAIQFILQLVEQINSVSQIYQILHLMFSGKIKMEIYSHLEKSPDFIFDKLFLDHNRMLDGKVLSETMDNDVKWFSKLDDRMQLSIIIDLFRTAGGGNRIKLFMPVTLSLHRKLRTYNKSHIFVWSPLSTVKLSEYSEDVEKYEPRHPSSTEVEKQRKRWDDIVSKYENEVNSKVKFLLGKDKTQTDSQNAKKKDNKENRGNKKLPEVICEDIDWLQLIPVEFVKKTFSYLNMDELRRASKVNSYWDYIVKDIIKERKRREDINKYLDQLKEKIDPIKLKNSIDEFNKKKSNTLLKTTPMNVGMISRKMIPKRTSQMVETSLISEVLKLEHQEYPALTGEYLAFPRIITGNMRIYRYKPCFLKDTNVRLGIEEDIDHQRSVLTYSLSEFASTIQLNLTNNVSLEDW